DAGTDAGTSSSWRVVFDDLPAPLLSAWQSNDGVLYAVGGSANRALVLRHDASGWWEMDPGTSRALWWVHGFSKSDVIVVGDAGVGERLVTVVGRGENEVYAVGGLRGPQFVRFDGARWAPIDPPGNGRPLNGVAVDPSGNVAISGLLGYLAMGGFEVPKL